MTKRPWPLDTPYKLSDEEEQYFEDLIKKLERGELKFRPLNEEEKARHKRMREDPITIITERISEDEFKVTMRCAGCFAEHKFDQTAPEPWSEYRDGFEEFHRNHKRKDIK